MNKIIGEHTYLIDDVTGDILGYAATPDKNEVTDTTQRRRGRPTKATPNPLYALIRAAAELNPSWLDDIVYGACVTSGGMSNGRMNLKPRHVLRTIMQPEIGVSTVGYGLGASERTKQKIAKAARHALGAITLYLERHPETYDRLTMLAITGGYGDDCFALGVLETSYKSS
ncbi:MAG: hypothetical protein CMK72_04225 [Pseudomonadaceae bacterium]|nr:hypothetical protein [Pseudomonadaceae bacterium]HCP53590.1 hypothetical protein [Pseudomonas sp.]